MADALAQGLALLRGVRAQARSLALKEPPTKETRAFEAAATRIDNMIVKLASGEGDEAATTRAIDKLDRMADGSEIRSREDREVFFARARELRAARTEAIEQGREARQQARRLEVQGLRQGERSAKPAPGTYLHELAVMAGRRRS